MATTKEAVVIVLDVGKSMCEGATSRLEGAVKAVHMLVQQKVCAIVFGWSISRLRLTWWRSFGGCSCFSVPRMRLAWCCTAREVGIVLLLSLA
jgi:hypothetical protein